MDQYVGTDDVFDRIQHSRTSCEIANPFEVEMGVAFLLCCRLATKTAVHFIMAGAEVLYLHGTQGRQRKQQSVSVIAVDLIWRKDFEHR
jgi:hypothetical protein